MARTVTTCSHCGLRVMLNRDLTCPSCRVHRDAPVTDLDRARIAEEGRLAELRGSERSARDRADSGAQGSFLAGALLGGLMGLLGLAIAWLAGGPETRRGALTLFVVRLVAVPTLLLLAHLMS